MHVQFWAKAILRRRWVKRWVSLIVGLAVSLTVSGLSAYPMWAQVSEPNARDNVLAMERRLEQDFENYFGQDLADVTQGPTEIGETLTRLGQETDSKPAVLWVIPRETHLHLVLVTAQGESIVRDLFDVPKALLVNKALALHRHISRPGSSSYKATAQQLHEWIIEPFESEYLQPEEIDTLLFCLGGGVRGLALAALYDGEQFLVEKYDLARIPAFNLIKTEYEGIQQGQLLAMGASEFETQNPLPAVPIELDNVVRELSFARTSSDTWDGQSLLNQDFTLQNLKNLLATQPFDIVHLATHAEFRPGAPDNSYIQFWDGRLGLDQTRQLDWQSPALDLLVLSACKTAVGDEEAELGFAGIALQAGVKSAMASLWNVSDAGTLALMSEFYRQLTLHPTKVEALRQAQLKMIQGDVRIEADRLTVSRGEISLPETLTSNGVEDFSHPFYWAGFTLISSPW